MSFRKRNVAVNSSTRSPKTEDKTQPNSSPSISAKRPSENHLPKGVRPSTVDGSPVLSTGTPSFDSLLAGHSGLALGNLLLIEESGATDYAGTLLRYYAAEGLLQDHQIHVVGAGEPWVRDLPGLARTPSSRASHDKPSTNSTEKMKIAWRYERFGDSRASSRGPSQRKTSLGFDSDTQEHVFCHEFDLTKRLEIPNNAKIAFIGIESSPAASPFANVISRLSSQLAASDSTAVHRVVIPSILSPALYPTSSCLPQYVLRFFHALRSLLRQYTGRLSAAISLPVTLYPRESGLTRWMELLSDGVLELIPFPHTIDAGPSLATSGAATVQEETPQGMAKLHRLPVFHERGGGMSGPAGVGDDLAFTVSRKKFVLKPFSLPPVEGDTDTQNDDSEGKPGNSALEF